MARGPRPCRRRASGGRRRSRRRTHIRRRPSRPGTHHGRAFRPAGGSRGKSRPHTRSATQWVSRAWGEQFEWRRSRAAASWAHLADAWKAATSESSQSVCRRLTMTHGPRDGNRLDLTRCREQRRSSPHVYPGCVAGGKVAAHPRHVVQDGEHTEGHVCSDQLGRALQVPRPKNCAGAPMIVATSVRCR